MSQYSGTAYPLTGATGHYISCGSDGTVYDSEVHVHPNLPTPLGKGSAYLELAVSAPDEETEYTLELVDVTSGEVLTHLQGKGSEPRLRSSPLYDELVAGHEYGIRVKVSNPSQDPEASMDVAGYLYVEAH